VLTRRMSFLTYGGTILAQKEVKELLDYGFNTSAVDSEGTTAPPCMALLYQDSRTSPGRRRGVDARDSEALTPLI
jgi:hypothetical protein